MLEQVESRLVVDLMFKVSPASLLAFPEPSLQRLGEFTSTFSVGASRFVHPDGIKINWSTKSDPFIFFAKHYQHDELNFCNAERNREFSTENSCFRGVCKFA